MYENMVFNIFLECVTQLHGSGGAVTDTDEKALRTAVIFLERGRCFGVKVLIQ
jgi:hypothetical protein